MKKIIISAIALWMCHPTVQAQKGNETYKAMGGGGFTLGYGYMDVSDLQTFAPKGTPQISNNMMVIGGTGHGFINRLVIGGSGFGIVGDVVKTDSVRTSVGGGAGTFDIGYLVLDREKVKAWPMIGIGGGGFGVQMTRLRNLTAGQVSGNPAQEININQGGLLADVSFNINFIPSVKYDPEENAYGGLMTGLKLGFIYSIPRSDWRYSGGEITGGPKFGLSMVYLKLVIGGFGYSKK